MLKVADTTGRKWGKPTLVAITMTPGLPLANTMMKGGVMMKKFDVNIKADTWYCAIEAETEQEAIERALEWFLEYEPDVCCMENEEEEEDYEEM